MHGCLKHTVTPEDKKSRRTSKCVITFQGQFVRFTWNSFGFRQCQRLCCVLAWYVSTTKITICMVSCQHPKTRYSSIPLNFHRIPVWKSWSKLLSKDQLSPLPPWSMMLPGQKKNPVAPSRRWWGRLRGPRHPPDKMTSCDPQKMSERPLKGDH